MCSSDLFAQGLARHGVELISTGGTRKALAAAGLTVLDVSEVTGSPEMMDGRVKTLHPKVHGGILARPGLDDGALASHGIDPIDFVIVNLYPFAATVAALVLLAAAGCVNVGGKGAPGIGPDQPSQFGAPFRGQWLSALQQVTLSSRRGSHIFPQPCGKAVEGSIPGGHAKALIRRLAKERTLNDAFRGQRIEGPRKGGTLGRSSASLRHGGALSPFRTRSSRGYGRHPQR